jgi:glycosyltransferase involved in cell wall biosynthesis
MGQTPRKPSKTAFESWHAPAGFPGSKPAILIVVENLPVPLDRRVWQESCALRDAGYEVVVICPRMRGCTEPEETLEGIRIYRHWISEEAGGLKGFFREYSSALWGELRLVWRAWRRHRFRIIHLCNPPDLLFLVAWPFKLFGVRILYDVHDLWPEMFEAKFEKRGLLYWLVRLAERMTYACADVVMATNESVREIAVTRGRKSAGKVFVVRTAPRIAGLDRPPDPSLRKGRRYLVGYIGVMGNADGVNYLVDAAAHLIQKMGRTDVQFLLMGTGPEHGRLVRQRDRLGLGEYVDLPGRVSNEFLFTALRTIDVGVSCDPINAYNHHCTMNKVLEYMTFAKPQVMFDLKEGRASAGEAALYVPENSASRLAEGIDRLLRDEAARERLGRLGAERIEGPLNWDRSVVQLLRAYETAWPDKKTGP